MIRSVFEKVAWMGRTASMVFGLALVMALVFGVATSAMGANGKPFLLGRYNVASAISTLAKQGPGPALKLQVGSGQPPLAVNSSARVANLNAATAGRADSAASAGFAANANNLDGMDSTQFARLGGFKATEVMDIPGPVPAEGTFTSNGGTLLISASGSGYRSSTDTTRDAGRIGMRVMIDGQFREGVETYTNDADSHKAFVSNNFVVTNLPAGTHKITLERGWDSQVCGTQDEHEFTPCTTTDGGDNFHVSVLEIPK